MIAVVTILFTTLTVGAIASLVVTIRNLRITVIRNHRPLYQPKGILG